MPCKSRLTIFRLLFLIVCLWFVGFFLFLPSPFTFGSKSARLLDEAQSRLEDTNLAKAALITPKKAPRPSKYLALELYNGRLNNQLWTLDWAFRCAKAFNRTLIVPAPLTTEQWIGMPESPEEEQYSIWDMSDLRLRFDFVTEKQAKLDPSIPQEVFLPPEQLDPHCVWDDRKAARDGIYVAEWLRRAPADCIVVYFIASHGLVHSFRASTQTLGVDQFAFWSALKPAQYLHDAVRDFFSQVDSKTTIAVHSRAHNSDLKHYPPGEAHPTCDYIARSILTEAVDHLQQAKECCQVSQLKVWNAFRSVAPFTFLSDLPENGAVVESLNAYFEAHLAGMCHITKKYLEREMKYQTESNKLGTVIRVTDHEWDDVEQIFDQFHAIEMNFTTFQSSGGSRSHLVKEPKKRRWHQNIERSVLDLLVLARADVMMGAPSSTFSKTACMWRGKERLATTNFCFLVMMEAGSNSCQSIDCNAFR